LRASRPIPEARGTPLPSTRSEPSRFTYRNELGGGPPYQKVPAPADFTRRFAQYKADTDLWVNTTFSPDVPDVELVTSRLYERDTGVATDGVIFADPRGVAALTPPDAALTVPGTDESLSRDELPEFVYWKAYERFDPAGDFRRDVLLGLGEQAFQATIDRGLGGAEAFEDIGAAAAGQHLRFVSFDENETDALARAGTVGDLEQPQGDTVFVTVDNLGGDKLDYWVQRTIEHNWRHRTRDGHLRDDRDAEEQRTRRPAALHRGTPLRLQEHRVRPAPQFRRDLQTRDRRDHLVQSDGEDQGWFPDGEEGNSAIGVEVRVPQGERSRVRVVYELPLEDETYSLTATPQPLARDAALKIDLELPSGWVLSGDAEDEDTSFDLDESMDEELEMRAGRDQRGGISGLWTRLVRFWKEPLF